MTERLLQYIWEFQYFNRSDLAAEGGESVLIFDPGTSNPNQGPDFLNARIKIGTFTWSGSVEIHLRTSDWNRHTHGQDPHYSNVILHVVWEHDGPVNDLPVLVLGGRVPLHLLHRYASLLSAPGFIPCGTAIASLSSEAWQRWSERLLEVRLQRKAALIGSFLQQNNMHWEETFWWMLARSFGSHLNGDLFEAVARSVSLTILSRHKSQLLQLEAILFGQAGLLNMNLRESYARVLQKEYLFLSGKYKWQPVHGRAIFLRMRPGNFPTIRLAQLAMLIHQTTRLFSRVRETGQLQDIRDWLDVTASDYWHDHYRFGDKSGHRPKKLGQTMIDSLVINTIIPMLFAYGNYQKESLWRGRVFGWLKELPAEANKIVQGYRDLGMAVHTAADSQVLLELKSRYCNRKSCLDCAVGNRILRTGG